MSRIPFAFVLAVLAGLLSGQAVAATTSRGITQVASGSCGANNPANDANLRRLPTGLRNVGTTAISVVCTQWGDEYGSTSPIYVYVFFRNEKTTTISVSCTLSQGIPYYGQVSTTRSISLGGGVVSSIQWDDAQYGTSWQQMAANLQGSLPPGVTMREIGFAYNENIGA